MGALEYGGFRVFLVILRMLYIGFAVGGHLGKPGVVAFVPWVCCLRGAVRRALFE